MREDKVRFKENIKDYIKAWKGASSGEQGRPFDTERKDNIKVRKIDGKPLSFSDRANQFKFSEVNTADAKSILAQLDQIAADLDDVLEDKEFVEGSKFALTTADKLKIKAGYVFNAMAFRFENTAPKPQSLVLLNMLLSKISNVHFGSESEIAKHDQINLALFEYKKRIFLTNNPDQIQTIRIKDISELPVPTDRLKAIVLVGDEKAPGGSVAYYIENGQYLRANAGFLNSTIRKDWNGIEPISELKSKTTIDGSNPSIQPGRGQESKSESKSPYRGSIGWTILGAALIVGGFFALPLGGIIGIFLMGLGGGALGYGIGKTIEIALDRRESSTISADEESRESTSSPDGSDSTSDSFAEPETQEPFANVTKVEVQEPPAGITEGEEKLGPPVLHRHVSFDVSPSPVDDDDDEQERRFQTSQANLTGSTSLLGGRNNGGSSSESDKPPKPTDDSTSTPRSK